MAQAGDVRDPAPGVFASGDLPAPEQLSLYSFRNRYDALYLPLWLALGAVTLVLLHILLMWLFHSRQHLPTTDPERIRWYLVSVFDLGEEESLGTWFSAVLLLFIGRLVWGHAKALLRGREMWAALWFVMAIAFHLMSIEEVLDGHATLKEYFKRSGEESGPAMRETLLWGSLFVGTALIPLLWQVRWRFGTIIVLSGALYLWGALGIDHWQGSTQHPEYADRYMWVALEEALEMLAPILFLHGLLTYLGNDPKGTIEDVTEIAR